MMARFASTEVLGGQWGEISVMMTYLFQGWNCRGPAKYRDMLLDIGTEAIAHVEMLATMIARLLEPSPVETQEEAAKNSVVGAVFGGGKVADVVLAGMNPQHAIVSGLGATPTDSVGYPWNARYTIASGNLLADFRFNVTAESQGRLQVTRPYGLTDDPGVRDMLSFLIARDTMHQNQWLAAIAELEAEGLDATPVPSNFPQSLGTDPGRLPVPELLRRHRERKRTMGQRSFARWPRPDRLRRISASHGRWRPARRRRSTDIRYAAESLAGASAAGRHTRAEDCPDRRGMSAAGA